MWLTLLLLALTGCPDPEVQLAEAKARGDAAVASGAYEDAIRAYQEALEIDPNRPDLHYALHDAYLGRGRPDKALWELQETLRLDPRNPDVKLAYADALASGDDRAAIEEGVILAAEVSVLAPDKVDAWVVQGVGLEKLGSLREAESALRTALEREPDHPRAVSRLAGVLVARDQLDEAEFLARRATELAPGFATHRALADLLAATGRTDAAEQAYRAALDGATDDERMQAVTSLAAHLTAAGRVEETERVLAAGVESMPSRMELLLALVEHHAGRGDPARAEAVIEDAAARLPEDPRPLLVLAEYRTHREDLDGALAATEAALAIEPDRRDATLDRIELLAEIGRVRGAPDRVAEARQLVDALLARGERADALFARASVELAESRAQDALLTLRRVTGERPTWAEAHYLMALALRASGDLQGAVDQCARALEFDPSRIAARRTEVQVLASLGENRKVVSQGKQLLGQRPGDTGTRVLVAAALARLGELDPALAHLETIPPGERSAELELAVASVLALQGNAKAARAALLRALERPPEQPGTRLQVLARIAAIDIDAGRPERALGPIDAVVAAHAGDAGLAELSALARLAAGQPEEARAALRRAFAHDADDLRAFESMTSSFVKSGKLSEMLGFYESVLAGQSELASLHYRVARLQDLRGHGDEALEHYATTLRLTPEHVPAKQGLARLLAERSEDLDRALALARDAKEARPEDPSVAATLGWVLFQRKRYPPAVHELEQAARSLAPDDPSRDQVRFQLASAYERNADFRKARELVAALEPVLSRSTANGAGEPSWRKDLRELRARLFR